jgi:hypothetical protein
MLRLWSLSGTRLVVVTSCRGVELNSAQMGGRDGACEFAEFGGVVFSWSLDCSRGCFTGDCDLSFDLPLPNMAAKLVDDFDFLGLSASISSSRGRLTSIDFLSFVFSSFFASVRNETELSVFLCRLFGRLPLLSCDFWGDGGLIGMFSMRVVARIWPCGWSGGSNGAWKLEAGMYGALTAWLFFNAIPSEGVRLWVLETIDLSTEDDLLRLWPISGVAMLAGACESAEVTLLGGPEGKIHAIGESKVRPGKNCMNVRSITEKWRA